MSIVQGISISNLWQEYLKLLATKPLATKAITGGCIAATGDLIAQKIITKKEEWDVYRTFKFLVYGMTLSGTLHFWYTFLDNFFKSRSNGNPKLLVLYRVLMDQILFAPVLNSLFFIIMTGLDGKPFEIPTKIKNLLLPQLQKHWSYWPIVQLFNFNYIPPHLRVLFGNFAALFWNMYLSIRNNRK